MNVTIRSFINQVLGKLRSTDDIITSISTWCGNANIRYTVYCKQADGTTYSIDIEEV